LVVNCEVVDLITTGSVDNHKKELTNIIKPCGDLPLGHVEASHYVMLCATIGITTNTKTNQSLWLFNPGLALLTTISPIQSTELAWCHCMNCRIKLASWIFSYLRKTWECDNFHTQCQIEVIKASLELEWWDLRLVTSFRRNWAFFVWAYFLFPRLVFFNVRQQKSSIGFRKGEKMSLLFMGSDGIFCNPIKENIGGV